MLAGRRLRPVALRKRLLPDEIKCILIFIYSQSYVYDHCYIKNDFIIMLHLKNFRKSDIFIFTKFKLKFIIFFLQ